MAKWVKRIALTLVMVGVAVAALFAYVLATFDLDFSFSESTKAHTDARNAFIADLPQTDCLRAEDITTVAQARGWQVGPDPDFNWCIAPADTIQSWLRVTIEPGLPFSTDDENAEMFGFDVNGCAVDWSYASGPGSTCPE